MAHSKIDNLNKWANRRTSYVFDILRIILGLFLLYKGIFFLKHTDFIVHLLNPDLPDMARMGVGHIVILLHVTGGGLIAFGLFTRVAVLAQLPIIAGAVFVNLFYHANGIELLQSTLALVVMAFFAVYGSGKHSLDYKYQMHI